MIIISLKNKEMKHVINLLKDELLEHLIILEDRNKLFGNHLIFSHLLENFCLFNLCLKFLKVMKKLIKEV